MEVEYNLPLTNFASSEFDMFLKQIKNLLPKRPADGVALETLVSQHQLPRLRGFRKLIRFFHLTRLYRISLGGLVLLYFSGYQPTLAVPPFKQIPAQAQESFRQEIKAVAFSQVFKLPHPGFLTTRYSSWHPGIDIAAGLGMPVHPISEGKVVEMTLAFWGLGHSVVIEHPEGFRSTYGHMGRVYVKKDALVTPASILGEVGMTGNTNGPHTHLEITRYDRYIDPRMILPLIPDKPLNNFSL